MGDGDLRVVTVTGPESTGKSTLARRLADTLGAEYSAEGARLFVERRLARGASADVAPEDLEPIARLQLEQEVAAAERARARGGALVVRDTDLVSTWVYARRADGPPWLERLARGRRADLYLLCDVDLPWADDPVRTPGGGEAAARRASLDSFEQALRTFRCRYAWVRGVGDARLDAALEAMRESGVLAEDERPG